MPKSYLIFKWAVYAAATLLLVLLQAFLLNYLRLWGITPFLPPMLVGVVASYEGSRSGPVFALVFGLLCDLAMAGPAPGFFTFVFTLAALTAALLAENLFSPGLSCSLMAVTVCCLFTAVGRILLLLRHGQTALSAMALTALMEFLVTLPFFAVVFLLYRRVHDWTSVEY